PSVARLTLRSTPAPVRSRFFSSTCPRLRSRVSTRREIEAISTTALHLSGGEVSEKLVYCLALVFFRCSTYRTWTRGVFRFVYHGCIGARQPIKRLRLPTCQLCACGHTPRCNFLPCDLLRPV